MQVVITWSRVFPSMAPSPVIGLSTVLNIYLRDGWPVGRRGEMWFGVGTNKCDMSTDGGFVLV